MQLLVPIITGATRQKDLKGFVNVTLEDWFRMLFSTRPKIVSTGVTERHGLIDVTPDDAALRVIKKLNGAYLKAKRVGINQYIHVTPKTGQEKVLTQKQQHRDTHQEMRVCKVCGHTFFAGQNTRRSTCSPDCEAERLSHNQRSRRSN